MNILECHKITKFFGGLAALWEADLEVEEGELLGLIGPNGAGKTTLFNIVTGFFPPTKGKVFFRGEDITGLKPHLICRQGISRTYQLVRVFPELSVLENVCAGAFFSGRNRGTSRECRKEAQDLLNLLGIAPLASRPAKTLTTVDRKRLEVARALASRPVLLLLDEVMAGLNPTETHVMMEVIRGIRRRGITVIMIEHVMRVVMSLSDRIVVLNHGQKLAEGPPKEVASNPAVISAYLGKGT